MPDNTLSTLEQIRIKIRRLTRSPSTAQISDATIDEYINNFVLYDFPEHLRTFRLRVSYSFQLTPFIDQYNLEDIAVGLSNEIINIYDPVYVSGRKQMLTQDRTQFFGLFPMDNSVQSIGTDGDGATVTFIGNLSGVPVLRDHVKFSSLGVNDTRLAIYDIPNDPNDGEGEFYGDAGALGFINYRTGAYDITFNAAPAAGETIYSYTVPYAAGTPSSVLFYGNALTFRPVPDKAYSVNFDVATRPAELLAGATMPELSQWWQYIAYGATKKIFEDRMDMESVQMITPEFKKQEILVNRRTIDQLSKERAATIYTGVSTGLTDFFN